MKPKYIYPLFIIIALLPIVALFGIDMNGVSYLNYIKTVALLTLFLSFVSMAIIMLFYMKVVDNGTSSIDDNVQATIEEVKTLLEESKKYRAEEMESLRKDVESGKAANQQLLAENETLTKERAILEKEKINLQNSLDEAKKANKSLLAEKETFTKERAILEKEKVNLQNSLDEAKKANKSLLAEKETFTKERAILEKEKINLQNSLDEKEKTNKELDEINKKLMEYARYGLKLTSLLKDEEDDAHAYLVKLKDFFSEYAALQQHNKMCEEIEGICTEASKTTPVYNNLLVLRDNMIRLFKEELQLQDLPLNDEIKRYNLSKLINIAMVAFDLMDTMEYSINNTESQKLSVEIALGLKDIKTEIAKCEQVDLDPNKTPRWLRALKSTLESTDADLSKSIISGRRL